MMCKNLKRVISKTLVGVLTVAFVSFLPISAYASDVLEEDVVLDTETDIPVAGESVSSALVPVLMRTTDSSMPMAAVEKEDNTDSVLYQRNVVRFVTSWNENSKTGGEFMLHTTDEFDEDAKLPEGVKSVNVDIISDGFEEDVDAIAVYDVWYEQDAEKLNVLPEVDAFDSDMFRGWVDADGKSVDENTKPEPGMMYYADFESEIVERNAWTGVLTENENALLQPAAVVKYVISEDAGEIYGEFDDVETLFTEKVDFVKLSLDEMTLTVGYTEDGVFEVLPKVHGLNGCSFLEWMDGKNAVIEEDEYEDEQVLTARFDKVGDSDVKHPDDEKQPGSDKDKDDSGDVDSDDKKNDDIHGDITVDNSKDNNQDNSNQNGNSNDKPQGVVSQNPPHIYLYVLHLTDTTGGTKDVKVQSDKSLKELAEALSYNVSKFAIKQASVTEYPVDDSMTMESVVELFKNGDIEVIAYDENGTAMGCAVAKVTSKDYEYDVLLSKDTNVALRTADEIKNNQEASVDSKGKGENPVSKEGKPDEQAPSIQTSDSTGWMLYVLIGVIVLVIAAAGVGYYVYNKKDEDDSLE